MDSASSLALTGIRAEVRGFLAHREIPLLQQDWKFSFICRSLVAFSFRFLMSPTSS